MSDKDLLTKGLVIAFIGAAVLLAPYFITSPAMRDVIAQSALVGWFALVLGGAFVVRWLLRRTK
jgi:VIT1/CCC1 family predicted Fe2+/Mn2+ transporter